MELAISDATSIYYGYEETEDGRKIFLTHHQDSAKSLMLEIPQYLNRSEREEYVKELELVCRKLGYTQFSIPSRYRYFKAFAPVEVPEEIKDVVAMLAKSFYSIPFNKRDTNNKFFIRGINVSLTFSSLERLAIVTGTNAAKLANMCNSSELKVVWL